MDFDGFRWNATSELVFKCDLSHRYWKCYGIIGNKPSSNRKKNSETSKNNTMPPEIWRENDYRISSVVYISSIAWRLEAIMRSGKWNARCIMEETQLEAAISCLISFGLTSLLSTTAVVLRERSHTHEHEQMARNWALFNVLIEHYRAAAPFNAERLCHADRTFVSTAYDRN